MKQTYPLLFGAFIFSSLPSIANADFYVGLEAADRVIKINQNDTPRKIQFSTVQLGDNTSNSDVSINYLDDIYKADNIGGNLFIGYKFKDNYAVEMGYFTSNGRYKDINYGTNAIGKMDIDSLSIDIKKSIKLDPSDALSFIGSLGVIYQKSTLTTKSLGSQSCVDPNGGACPWYFVASETQRKFYDTRLELGLGASYDIDKQFTLRSTVSFIPNDLSLSSSTPYYISIGALYNF